MASRRGFILYMTAARGFAAPASSAPPATARKALLARGFAAQASSPPPPIAGKGLLAPTTSCKSLNPALTSGFRRRNILCYGALAAVAGAGIYYFLCSGNKAVLTQDDSSDDDLDTENKKSIPLRYGALACMAGAGILLSLASPLKPHAVMDALASTGPRGPSRREVRKLTVLMEKVYKRLPQEDTVVKTDKDTVNQFVNWFNRFKEVLMLPGTLKDLYALVVTMGVPFIQSSLDDSICCTCPFSGLTIVADTWIPKEDDGNGAEDDEISPRQNLQDSGAVAQVKDVNYCSIGEMAFFPEIKSLQYYEISARSKHNLEKPSGEINYCSIGEMTLFPEYVTPELLAQGFKSLLYYEISARSKNNLEKPFHTARKPSGDINIKFVEEMSFAPAHVTIKPGSIGGSTLPM